MNFGLQRIAKLLDKLGNPQREWKAVHVAGTNGKGSVCAYVSAALHASGVRTGRFTSPHLIHRWDGIVLNEQVVDESLFRSVERRIEAMDAEFAIGASSFERLTAIAFEIFRTAHMHIGVIEAGLGGRLDATNVFERPVATVLARIGLDHVEQLGGTVEEIAREKAGIMKRGCACIVSGANEAHIVDQLRSNAEKIGAEPFLIANDKPPSRFIRPSHFPENMACAFAVLQSLHATVDLPTDDALWQAMSTVRWRGRNESLTLTVDGSPLDVFVDGAHNVQAAEALSRHVHNNLREDSVTWVYSSSSAAKTRGILASLLSPNDTLLIVPFSKVDSMAWIESVATSAIRDMASEFLPETSIHEFGNVTEALAFADAAKKPVVVCGSLYLISDVYRLALV